MSSFVQVCLNGMQDIPHYTAEEIREIHKVYLSSPSGSKEYKTALEQLLSVVNEPTRLLACKKYNNLNPLYLDPAINEEDLWIQAIIRITQCLPKWNPDKASLTTWAYRIASCSFSDTVERGVLGMCTRSVPKETAETTRYKKMANSPPVRLDEKVLTEDGDMDMTDVIGLTYPDRSVVPEDLLDKTAALFRSLSEGETQVLHCMLNGYTYQEMGNIYHKNKKWGDNCYQRILKKAALIIPMYRTTESNAVRTFEDGSLKRPEDGGGVIQVDYRQKRRDRLRRMIDTLLGINSRRFLNFFKQHEDKDYISRP